MRLLKETLKLWLVTVREGRSMVVRKEIFFSCFMPTATIRLRFSGQESKSCTPVLTQIEDITDVSLLSYKVMYCSPMIVWYMLKTIKWRCCRLISWCAAVEMLERTAWLLQESCLMVCWSARK